MSPTRKYKPSPTCVGFGERGVVVPSDAGDWEVVETPGHAPSHVCLIHRPSRMMVTGDHLLPRVGLHFDYGFSPDPLAEFLGSLDAVERCGVLGASHNTPHPAPRSRSVRVCPPVPAGGSEVSVGHDDQ